MKEEENVIAECEFDPSSYIFSVIESFDFK